MAKPILDLPFPSLERLLGSISPRVFFADWWERAPGLFAARSATDRESFRRADWRELARAARELDGSAVEVIAAGRPGKAASEGAIDEGVDGGGSARILRVQRVWPFLDDLCKSLQWELGFKVSANLYVTPEGRQGLDSHADSHDVLVIQMAGRKDWEIFGSPYVLPIGYRAPMVFEDGARRDHRGDEFGGRGYKGQDVGPRLIQCSLGPGDLLYTPRGFVHHAVASHGTSVHVTIGIHATTWGDLLALAAAQESRTEASLRETLPPGATRVALPRDFAEAQLRERAGKLLERLHGEALLLETAARFAGSSAEGTGSGTDGDRVAKAETVVAVADPAVESNASGFDPAGRYRLARDGYVSFRATAIDLRSLHQAGNVHTLPAAFKPLVDSLVQGREVCPSAAPPLTPRSAEVLFARLVGAGILVPAE